MTKKLESIFNLEDAQEKIKDKQTIEQSFNEITEAAGSLPLIKELKDLGEKELDNLAKKAEAAYDDLMDLGMNVEVRYASRIFEVASSMLGHSINASNAKMERRLKAVDLQLKKMKLDKKPTEDTETIDGQAFVITDRNELMKKLGKQE